MRKGIKKTSIGLVGCIFVVSFLLSCSFFSCAFLGRFFGFGLGVKCLKVLFAIVIFLLLHFLTQIFFLLLTENYLHNDLEHAGNINNSPTAGGKIPCWCNIIFHLCLQSFIKLIAPGLLVLPNCLVNIFFLLDLSGTFCK